MNRNYVYVVPTAHNTYNVINYSGKSEVNSFLHLFDIWGRRGRQKMCSDGNHSAFWFECSDSFFILLHTQEMKRAFERLGVVLTFDDADILPIY
jgi:hypothetical protein